MRSIARDDAAQAPLARRANRDARANFSGRIRSVSSDPTGDGVRSLPKVGGLHLAVDSTGTEVVACCVMGSNAPVRHAARRTLTGLVVVLVMAALGLGILRIAPVVVYRCAAAETGARCTVTHRYAGLADLERAEAEGIKRAAAESWEQRSSSTSGGKASTSSESMSKLTLFDAAGEALFSDTQSGAVGSSVDTLALAIEQLDSGERAAPFLRWQGPWLPYLFASLMLLIAIPTLLEYARGTVWRGPPGGVIMLIEFLAGALPLLAAWALLLIGYFPDALAAALGVPGG